MNSASGLLAEISPSTIRLGLALQRYPPGKVVEPSPSNLTPKSLAESVEIALRESPAVVSALYREQAARFNIELIRGELLPSVQLEANYARRFDPSFGVEDAW